MNSYARMRKLGNGGKRTSTATLAALMLVGLLTGCATKTEFVYVEPDCVAPAIEEPKGFAWDALQYVPKETKRDIDETVQHLIDEVLERQAMLEELCGE